MHLGKVYNQLNFGNKIKIKLDINKNYPQLLTVDYIKSVG